MFISVKSNVNEKRSEHDSSGLLDLNPIEYQNLSNDLTDPEHIDSLGSGRSKCIILIQMFPYTIYMQV